jgi:hypothetical protein
MLCHLIASLYLRGSHRALYLASVSERIKLDFLKTSKQIRLPCPVSEEMASVNDRGVNELLDKKANV